MPDPSVKTTLTPLLVVSNTHEAIDFYQRGFGASTVQDPVVMPQGEVAYAEVEISGARFALKDAAGPGGDSAPDGEDNPVILTLQVADVDSLFTRAIQAGATEVFGVDDRFYGFRDGRLQDPFGHVWIIQTPIPHGHS
jgi:PhnB protein